MIQRSWRARASADRAHLYVEHLTRTVLPKLEQLDGFRGLVLSQRRDGDAVELVVQTYWASMQAIEQFAGPTPDAMRRRGDDRVPAQTITSRIARTSRGAPRSR